MKKAILFAIVCISYLTNAHATIRTASINGNWNDMNTWGGTIPNANDDVIINSGVTVTINVNPNNIANVTINGTLQWDATGTGHTWTVTGTLTINSGGIFNCLAPGSATTHTFNYNGTSFTNNGTFNMVNGTNKCNVVIGGSATQTFNGANNLSFNKLTLSNTAGKFQIDYSTTFTPSEISPTQFNISFSTADTLLVKQGLLIVCARNNAIYSSSASNLRMGSSTSKISSSVNAFTGVATITMNTCVILNDATNANISLFINGSFISPDMTQANSAIAFALLGPNCQGGNSNATQCVVGGDMNIPDLFGFVGNAKLFGGVEPRRPDFIMNGNVYWQYSKSHTLDIPFTSQDIVIKTFFFGLFDSQGTHPRMILNGSNVTPYTFNIPFHVFDAPIQHSNPPGSPIVAQISESAADWLVNGNYSVVNGASIAVHSDDTLAIADYASLHVQSGGEVAGSETETDPAGYTPTNGPLLHLATNATIYTENILGFGKGVLADSTSDVSFKNRTADLDWNLNEAASAGTVKYAAAASQTVTDRTYNNFNTSGSGTKTLANAITINGITNIGASTTLANGGFTATTKGLVTNDGSHSGTGKIILGGTVLQGLNGSGSDWGNVEINNAAGASTYQNVTSSGTVTFTNGILNTTSTAKLILTTSGSVSGGSSLSCVYGPMDKIMNTPALFLFPVGKGGNYRPLSFTSNAFAPITFTAEYFASAYSNTTTFHPPITSVNTHSYWTLNHSGANVFVTLTWGSTEALSDLNGLTVAGFDGSAWYDAGESSITGTPSSGTITSQLVLNYSIFTLGEANTITTNSISGSPFCPGASVSVPFTSTGTFNAGNIYTAQLSDKKGAFGTPTAIGTLSSTANSGSIGSNIPTNTKGAAKYRIRVVSSNPVVTGSDNGTNLSVTACGAPVDVHTSATTSTTATFNWSAITCAYSYTLEYRLQGTSTWKKKKNLMGLSYTLTGLTANTTYEYAMQTFCTSDNKSKSSFTSTQTLATTLRLSSPITSAEQTFIVFPNPATDNVGITINSNETNTGTIKIFNAVGQVMMEEMVSLTEGSNQVALNISSLSSGIYFVEVKHGDVRMMDKLVKE